jgi:hypothetical protein
MHSPGVGRLEALRSLTCPVRPSRDVSYRSLLEVKPTYSAHRRNGENDPRAVITRRRYAATPVVLARPMKSIAIVSVQAARG